MPQHEFERFLSLLSKLLKLSSKETAEIADELCDHLEERYSELIASGVSREEAVKQALDEFEDASLLATRLTSIVRDRKRRRMMTGTLGTAAAAVALVATTAFWPDQPRPAGAPQLAQASDRAESPQEAAAATAAAPTYIDPGQFLPEGLNKHFEADVNNVPLREFASSLQKLNGVVTLIDWPNLQEAGLDANATVSARTKDVPAWLALSRALERVSGVRLEWSLKNGLLTITTRERAEETAAMTSMDVSSLLTKGYSADAFNGLILEMTAGPWEVRDGEGGSINILGNVLTIRASTHLTLEVQALLKALASDQQEVHIGQPLIGANLEELLDTRVSIEAAGTLEAVIGSLAQQLAVPILLDSTALNEAGLAGSAAVSMGYSGIPLRALLEIPVDGVRLALIVNHGQLLLTTEERARDQQTTVVFSIGDLIQNGDVAPLINLIQDATRGLWRDSDGEGGAMASYRPDQLLVRQTAEQLAEVRKLLAVHRQLLAHTPATPPEDPNQIEIRYYRLPEKTADDLVETLPRFVAPSTWAMEGMMNSPDRIGLIQKVYVGDDANFGGMGGGGGGFMQISGTAAGDAGTGQAAGFRQSFTVLVIRQTRAVHKEIRKFINELLHGDANRSQGLPTPSDGISWPSRLKESAIPSSTPTQTPVY